MNFLGLLTIYRDNRGFLVTRWDATLVQCQRVLSAVDWQRASATTPGRLGRYLQVLQEHCHDVVTRSKIGYIMQAVEIFKQLADEIDISMSPTSLDLSIIWGLTALLIEVSRLGPMCRDIDAKPMSSQ